MKPVRRIACTALLLAAPALLTVRMVRKMADRTTSAIRGTEPPVAGPLFAAPEPALAPVPTFASELPIAAYDALSAKDATTAIKELSDPDQVRLVLRHEEENAKGARINKSGI